MRARLATRVAERQPKAGHDVDDDLRRGLCLDECQQRAVARSRRHARHRHRCERRSRRALSPQRRDRPRSRALRRRARADPPARPRDSACRVGPREEHEIRAIRAGRHGNGAVSLIARRRDRSSCDRCAASLVGSGVTISTCLQALRAIGMLHQFGNPHRLARLVLAGENPHAARRFRDRPLKGAEFRRRQRAVRHRHRPLEIGRADRLDSRAREFPPRLRPNRPP